MYGQRYVWWQGDAAFTTEVYPVALGAVPDRIECCFCTASIRGLWQEF